MHSNKFNKLIEKWRNNPGTHVYHTFSQQLITELNSTQLKTKRMWETCNLTLKYIVKKKFLKFKEEGMCLLKFLLHSFHMQSFQCNRTDRPPQTQSTSFNASDQNAEGRKEIPLFTFSVHFHYKKQISKYLLISAHKENDKILCQFKCSFWASCCGVFRIVNDVNLRMIPVVWISRTYSIVQELNCTLQTC